MRRLSMSSAPASMTVLLNKGLAVAPRTAKPLDETTMVSAINEAIKNIAPHGISVPPVFHTPVGAATYFINAKHAALGGATGFLGANTTPVTVCPDKVGYFQHFKGGSIYWHPHTGAHEV